MLGEGSYGKVFCGIEKSENKPYAIKILDKYHIMKVHNYYSNTIDSTKKLRVYLEKETSLKNFHILI